MEKKNEYYDENDVKPRKWLMVILIIIALVIIVLLINKIIVSRQNKNIESCGVLCKINKRFENNDFDSDFDKTSFNNNFEMYTGTKYGLSVRYILDEAVTNNKKNDRKVTVLFNDKKISDPDEIISIKSSLEDWTNYEVSLNYDNDGYVSEIVIR